MLDGQRHELRVTLADAAKIQHRGVRLSLRNAAQVFWVTHLPWSQTAWSRRPKS